MGRVWLDKDEGNHLGINNITNPQWQTKGETQTREFSPAGRTCASLS
jgi:hypothetical protein